MLILLTVIFATGVLSIPNAAYSLGAPGGAISVIGWVLSPLLQLYKETSKLASRMPLDSGYV